MVKCIWIVDFNPTGQSLSLLHFQDYCPVLQAKPATVSDACSLLHFVMKECGYLLSDRHSKRRHLRRK